MKYIVVGERKNDQGTTSRVFWVQRDENRDPEFSEWKNGIILFDYETAIEAIAFLTQDTLMDDGFRECERCLMGSRPVFNIQYEKHNVMVLEHK